MAPAPWSQYGTWDIDDLERLSVMAQYDPAPSFDVAFARLKNGTDRTVAEQASANPY